MGKRRWGRKENKSSRWCRLFGLIFVTVGLQDEAAFPWHCCRFVKQHFSNFNKAQLWYAGMQLFSEIWKVFGNEGIPIRSSRSHGRRHLVAAYHCIFFHEIKVIFVTFWQKTQAAPDCQVSAWDLELNGANLICWKPIFKVARSRNV